MDHAIFLMRMMFLGLVALLLVVEGGWCKDHVNIVNNMATDTLQVHCHSRDNDLGVQWLVPNQWYVISFHHNIWGTTLFTCDFNAPGHQTKSVHVYEGYLVAHRQVWCTQCTWTVTDTTLDCDGFLFYSWWRWLTWNLRSHIHISVHMLIFFVTHRSVGRKSPILWWDMHAQDHDERRQRIMCYL